MGMEDKIRTKLTQSLKPISLTIVNESKKHKGHAGDDGSGETHFHVEVVSGAFSGLSRVACQRMVYTLLDEEFKSGLHALSLRLSPPSVS